ncbi:MAG: hypothetical protein WB392_07625 [Methanotrichaceae archaeon]
MINNKRFESTDQIKANGQREREVRGNLNLLPKAEKGKKIDPTRIWWL